MKIPLVTYWNYGKTFCSIEHVRNSEGKNSTYVLLANRKHDEFEIKKTFNVDSREEVTEHLPKNQHALLNISGSNVLVRSGTGTGNDISILTKAFPNLNIDEFYYQILRSGDLNIIFICRKDYVEKVIDSFEKQGVQIIGFSLEFSAVSNILPILKYEKISLPRYSLSLQDDNITGFEKTQDQEENISIDIEDITIQNNYLNSLALLFSYFLPSQIIKSNFEDRNKELRKLHKEKNFFRKGLATGVGVLLVALLINFFLFSAYYKKLQEVQQRHNITLSQKETTDQKLKEIKEKENLVANIIKNSNSRSTFFLNQITGTVPESFLLSELSYQPLQKKIKPGEPVSLDRNQIRISGEIENEEEFSTWITRLEQTPWVEKTDVTDFSFKSRGISEFSLVLHIIADDSKK